MDLLVDILSRIKREGGYVLRIIREGSSGLHQGLVRYLRRTVF